MATRTYTFVINTYPSKKRKKELTKCLDSIFAQTYKDISVLVVENYETDKKILPIINNYKRKKRDINFIIDPTKRLSRLFDIGWRNARTEHLAYVADDVELEKDWLINIDSELTKSRKIGVVTGPIISSIFPASEMHRLYLLSQKSLLTRILTWPYFYFSMEQKPLAPGNLFESGAYSLGAALEEARDFEKQEIDLATTSSMGLKKSVLEKINGFDQRFNFNHADGDLFIRIKAAGYKIIFNPKAVSHHHLRFGPSRNAYIIGVDTGMYYRKHVRPKSARGIIGALINVFVLNAYWVYNAIRTEDLNQLKGVSGFFEGYARNI